MPGSAVFNLSLSQTSCLIQFFHLCLLGPCDSDPAGWEGGGGSDGAGQAQGASDTAGGAGHTAEGAGYFPHHRQEGSEAPHQAK